MDWQDKSLWNASNVDDRFRNFNIYQMRGGVYRANGRMPNPEGVFDGRTCLEDTRAWA